jgi:hypothetical protein
MNFKPWSDDSAHFITITNAALRQEDLSYRSILMPQAWTT